MRRRVARTVLAHLGPRGVLIALTAPIWITTGLGTLGGHARTPPGAPHLLLPEVWRGWGLWIIPGLIALAMLVPRRCDIAHRVAVAALIVAPVVCALSYEWSWLMWLIPWDPVGWPGGYYGAAVLAPYLLTILAMIYAPDTWHYLSADKTRAERREAR